MCPGPQYDGLFAAALLVNFARGTLTAGKLATLALLLACGRVWLYWLFFAGRCVDVVLAKHLPGLRRFCWFNFAVWATYLAVTPAGYYPLPFWPFAPSSMI